MNNTPLELKKWAQTLAWDLALEDELENNTITAVFPNEFSVDLFLDIEEVRVYKNEYERTVLTLIASSRSKFDDHKYIIRLYSPNMPRIKSFDDLIGKRIHAIKALCTIKHPETDTTIIIAHSLKIKETPRSKRVLSILETVDELDKSTLFPDILKGNIPFVYGNQSNKLKTLQTLNGERLRSNWFPYLKK